MPADPHAQGSDFTSSTETTSFPSYWFIRTLWVFSLNCVYNKETTHEACLKFSADSMAKDPWLMAPTKNWTPKDPMSILWDLWVDTWLNILRVVYLGGHLMQADVCFARAVLKGKHREDTRWKGKVTPSAEVGGNKSRNPTSAKAGRRWVPCWAA